MWDPRVRREAEILAEEGYAVHVVALRAREAASPRHPGGVHLHEVPLARRRGGAARYAFQYVMFLILAATKLFLLHLRRPFDLVHVHSLPDFLVFAAAPLKIRRVPILLDLHEAMPEILAARMHAGFRDPLVRAAVLLERASVAFADHVIAASDGIRAAVVRRGLPESRVTTVYNAGDLGPSDRRPEDVRSRLRLPPGRLLVHAGGVNPERDLETLLRALARLPTDEGAHLVVAGDGDAGYVRALSTLAGTLGLADRVHFVGRLSLEDARSLMSLSFVGLVTLEANPLTEIAWPTRIVEYAHLERPLLVPRLGFVAEVLGDAARYYTPGDPESLASELQDALRANEGPKASVTRAREICRRFSWSQMRRRLLDVFRAFEGHHAG